MASTTICGVMYEMMSMPASKSTAAPIFWPKDGVASILKMHMERAIVITTQFEVG